MPLSPKGKCIKAQGCPDLSGLPWVSAIEHDFNPEGVAPNRGLGHNPFRVVPFVILANPG